MKKIHPQTQKSSDVFRRNVQTILHEQGLTHDNLAVMVGTSRPGISRILAGIDGVTLNRAERIAKALGFTLSALIRAEIKIPEDVY